MICINKYNRSNKLHFIQLFEFLSLLGPIVPTFLQQRRVPYVVTVKRLYIQLNKHYCITMLQVRVYNIVQKNCMQLIHIYFVYIYT